MSFGWWAPALPTGGIANRRAIHLRDDEGMPLIDLNLAIRRRPAPANLFSRRELAWGHFFTSGTAFMAQEVGH